MKRIDWKAPLIVFAAFVLSTFVQLFSGRILRFLLPAALARESTLFALLLRMVFSVLIIIGAVRLLYRKEKE